LEATPTRPGRLFDVIVTDYDRTLTDGDLHLSERALRLLQDIREKDDVGVILATGRSLKFVKGIAREVGFMDAVVCENGGVLWFPRLQQTVSLGDTAAVKEILLQRGLAVGEGEVIISLPREREEEVRALLKDSGFSYGVEFNRDSMMVVPAGISKASGVRKALELLKMPDARLLCVGDGENDMSLFAIASVRVATAEAIEPLKETADLVCGHPASQGVEFLLEDLLEGRLGPPLREIGGKVP
jgi:phosphoglycolate phosphatase (TIGR01487 family)